jgi:hypothetical protein
MRHRRILLLNCFSFISAQDWDVCIYVCMYVCSVRADTTSSHTTSARGCSSVLFFVVLINLKIFLPPRLHELLQSSPPRSHRPIGSELGSATAESKEAKERRFRASNRLGLLLEPVCPAFLALHALISELRPDDFLETETHHERGPRRFESVQLQYIASEEYIHAYIHKSEIVFLLNTIARLGYNTVG